MSKPKKEMKVDYENQIKMLAVSTRNAAIAVAAVCVLAIGTYVAVSSTRSGAPSSSSQHSTLTSSTAISSLTLSRSQIGGLLNLFGNFSHVQFSSSFLDEVNENAGQFSYSYSVLGRTL
jgi:hypothetical protein